MQPIEEISREMDTSFHSRGERKIIFLNRDVIWPYRVSVSSSIPEPGWERESMEYD